MISMQIYNKETLIEALINIKRRGWIPNARPGNVGGIGNTIEDLLGIEENNLPLPNAAEWELKCQRIGTSSLTTLFHMEPSPTAIRFVPRILLPLYGWRHQEAGTTHPANEMSFRQTINGLSRTNRGFGIVVDRDTRRVLVSFDSNAVDPVHSAWLNSVDNRVGLDELEPQPYWGFDDLFHKVGTKLLNCFYLRAETKREAGITYFHYTEIMILQGLNLNRLISGMESGYLYVDFDARTGHNHGTKFRLRQDRLPELYGTVEVID
jgi:hypothetical protein